MHGCLKQFPLFSLICFLHWLAYQRHGLVVRAGVGNCFSQGATCGKTKSFPGRIIKWIKLICSTTIIVRVALIGKQKKKKKVYTLRRCPAFHRKYRWSSGVGKNFKKRAIISTFFDRLFIKQNYFEADWHTKKAVGGPGACSHGIILKIYML